MHEHTVLFVSGPLRTERRRLEPRAGRRSPGCYRQAILIVRWLLDGTRVIHLAVDNQISRSTGYAYPHEDLAMLAAHAPGLESVPLAAKMAGHAHVDIDGTLIETDRCRTPGPTPRESICGGQENTTTTAETSRSSPHQTPLMLFCHPVAGTCQGP